MRVHHRGQINEIILPQLQQLLFPTPVGRMLIVVTLCFKGRSGRQGFPGLMGPAGKSVKGVRGLPGPPGPPGTASPLGHVSVTNNTTNRSIDSALQPGPPGN